MRYLVEQGVAPERLGIDGDRLTRDYLEGRLDGHSDLAHRAATLYAAASAGWLTSDLADLVGPFLADVDRPLVFAFVPALLDWLGEHGIVPVVVTGAPAELVVGYVEPAGGRVVGLTLAESGGRYTGAVGRNPGPGTEKARVVAELEREGFEVVLGAGDTESDIPLLQAARRQLVVGNPALSARFPGTSLLIDPRATTGDELRQGLDRLLAADRLRWGT
ncbi:MAG: haloacid dehalogenase-like hydrolase [Actinomycetota bacterium]|nr:haloacid dehalogenase-like hydrolase [Actinomycetota bacterium]